MKISAMIKMMNSHLWNAVDDIRAFDFVRLFADMVSHMIDMIHAIHDTGRREPFIHPCIGTGTP